MAPGAGEARRDSGSHRSQISEALSSRGWLNPIAERKRRSLILITDPGPDPDDVKAILVAAMLHRRRRLLLKAVVANGGKQALARARLAQCLLNHVGVTDVPVGIGSEGSQVYTPQPHEYRLPGYDAVRDEQLYHGHSLLVRALESSAARSVYVVCISSLRDLADVMEARPDLAFSRVRAVSVQGGLAPDPSAPFGWVPDTSVNNTFDMEAAAYVYHTCLSRGLQLQVVSRHAVPLLPMQLARSFAERTDCPVMRYLSDAQFLGLEGLWKKLCGGKLPARCTKQWYFETFCGVGPAEFKARRLGRLGPTADIVEYLNGFVKPYDVLALMTVLPETAHHFSVFASAARAVEPTADASALRAHARRFPRRAPDEAPGGGTTHWLFLDAAHMIDVNHVLNLLRDVYHDVVNATRAASGDGGPLSARPRAAGLGTRLLAPCVGAAARAPTASGASWQQAGARGGADGSARGAADDAAPRSAAHAAAPPRGHTRRWRDLPLDSPAAAAARPPVRERLLEPVRPGSSELHACAMGYDELCARFDAALGGARRRQMSIALATLTAGIIVLVACSASYALETSALLAVNPGVSASVIYDMYDGYAIRTHVYLLGGQASVVCMLLSLVPTDSQIVRIRMVALAPILLCWIVSLPHVDNLAAVAGDEGYQDTFSEADPKRDGRFYRGVWTAHYAVRVLQNIGLWSALLVAIVRHWHSARVLLRATWVAAGLYILLSALLDLNILVWTLESGMAAQRPLGLFVVVACSVAVGLLIGPAVVRTRSREQAQAVLARALRSGGPEASLAPLLGYGVVSGEVEPRALVLEAAMSFLPVALDDVALGLLASGAMPFSLSDTRRVRTVSSGLMHPPSWSATHAPRGAVLLSSSEQRQQESSTASRLIAARARLQARHRSEAFSRAPAAASTEGADEADLLSHAPRADAFVVHCHRDPRDARVAALGEWARAFEVQHGRRPVVWLDGLSQDHSLLPTEQLAHELVYLGRCSRLLVLGSASLVQQLWPVVELYAWRMLGSRLQEAEAVIVGGASEGAARATVSAFDAFHVLYAQHEGKTVEKRLTDVIELAGVGPFNRTIREYLPAIERASELAASERNGEREEDAAARAARLALEAEGDSAFGAFFASLFVTALRNLGGGSRAANAAKAAALPARDRNGSSGDISRGGGHGVAGAAGARADGEADTSSEAGGGDDT